MKVEVIAIADDEDYLAAKALMESLMDAESGAEVSRLRAQALLVAAWEQAKSPAVPPDPVEAIKFRMEQMVLDPAISCARLGRAHVFRKCWLASGECHCR
jgi:antitoxin component HigA of HigAB toxin-antitoxin module